MSSSTSVSAASISRVRNSSVNGESRGMSSKPTGSILKALRAAMVNPKHVSEALAAYIVPSEDAHQSEYIGPMDERREYVSGFSGSRGLAAITMHAAALWTDGRYFLQAEQQLDVNWTLQREGQPGTPTLGEWLITNTRPGDKVGVDPFLMSAVAYGDLNKELSKSGRHMVAVNDNLVDLIWGAAKPTEPLRPLIVLPDSFTGKSWPEKIKDVRGKMAENKVKLLVVSALDEIAWLFNLRGSDIKYNPVFFSYACVGFEFVSLFIREEKLTDEVRIHLQGQVHLLPYASITDYVANYAKDTIRDPLDNVWLPSESTSQAIAALIPQNQTVSKTSPISYMKSIKNPVELNGMRNAHLKDAVAHAEFLFWLEKEITSKGDKGAGNNITEIIAAEKFQELRREQADYISLSFETISSVGEHGSIIHYSPTQASDALITADKIYLLDSGAQYKDGTTDVTRTICFDPPTAFQKKTFTLVLKGHIALAKQKFPTNIAGVRLDTIARMSLWNEGLDYLHGTGHGVGHFLNVHEGPAGIGYRCSTYAKEGIKENMVTSIEPGYYQDNEFGIRIESIFSVVPAEVTHPSKTQFLTFDCITLVPIQTKMIDPSLLSEDEITWLNDYHLKVREQVGAMLRQQGKDNVYKWLYANTEPLG